MTLELYTYADTDITRSSNSASLSLTDGTYFKVDPSWPGPAPAHLDAQSGQYLDIQERIPLIAQGANTNARDGIVQLGLWARKTQLYKGAHEQGDRVWMKYQPTGAGSAVWTRVSELNAEIGNGRNCTLSVTRSGLFEGDYTVVNCENLWSSAASAVTISNHMDKLTHVFDYDNNGQGSPYTGGNYSANNPTYIMANASNAASGAVTEAYDGVYFGCTDDKFTGFYLNVGTAASYSSPLVWQMYQGGWTTITVTDDTEGFTVEGINKISWASSELATWTTTAVNSVTAYWVRVLCTAAFSSGTSPAALTTGTTQMGVDQNRLCSHVNYVKVSSASIKGDAPGICQISVKSTDTAAQTLRVAKRTVGTLPTSVNLYDDRGGTADATSWGGFYANHAAPNSTFTSGPLALTLGPDNFGTWRAFARAYATTTATTAELRVLLKHVTSNVVIHTGDAGTPGAADTFAIVDLGLINVWSPEGTDSSNIQAYVQYRRSSGAEAIREDALILLPADEFYHTVRSATGNSTSYAVILNGFDQHVYIASAPNGTLYQILEPFGQQLTLEPGKDNYFFFLTDRASYVNTHTDKATVTIYYVPRWTSVRGTS